MNADYGLGIAARTSDLNEGIVPAIYRLAEEDIKSTWRFLHAARDGLRSELIPLNRTLALAVLIKPAVIMRAGQNAG